MSVIRCVIVAVFSVSTVAGSAVAAEEAVAERPLRVAALETALANSPATDSARAHYAASDYSGLWISADGDDFRARAFLAALDAADAHGLPASRYRASLLRSALATAGSGDVEAAAAVELAFTSSFLRYARDLSSGALEPRSVDRELHVHPERPDEATLLTSLAAAPPGSAFFDHLAPKDPDYRRLLDELAVLRAAPADLWGAKVPGGRSIRPGQRSARVEAMRARLTALGDHANDAATPEDPLIYDESLQAGVRTFQRRHGLNEDGVAGPKTIRAMNASIQERIGQILVNLERIRWLNRDLGDRHIYVNQADFTVRLVERGRVLFRERVVVGKARRHRTPEFSDEMTHLVFNPVWHLPRSIATEEVLPKLQADPDYLAKRNMRLYHSGGGVGPDASLIDWSAYSASDFPYRIKQRSGGGNALGRVKFMFPNQFSIYLHDTPSKRLFAKDARAFSHGCVRVQDPMSLARALLARQTDDADAFVDSMLARGRERRVDLDSPVDVHLTYRTAWINDEGDRHYRVDVYGRDARVLGALKAAGVEVGIRG